MTRVMSVGEGGGDMITSTAIIIRHIRRSHIILIQGFGGVYTTTTIAEFNTGTDHIWTLPTVLSDR